MKLCYFDESGVGEEPVVVVTGIVVDSQRMHVTKEGWGQLLDSLSNLCGRKLHELHTKDFHGGSGPFRKMAGSDRAKYITEVVSWFCERKHDFVYSAIQKDRYTVGLESGKIHPELETAWVAGAFHCILAIQRAFQKLSKPKGHTILVFDEKGHEQKILTKLVLDPPTWSDSFYSKRKGASLDQIIDVPYFADSRHVPMIQLADFLAYFLRRYVEISDKLVPPKYPEEEQRIRDWVKKLSRRCVGFQHLYPNKGRCATAELFYEHAPVSLRRISA